MGRNKDHLLGELVNYDQDSVKLGGWQKFLDEVYRNGISWLLRNGELFERSVKLVMLWLGLHTSDTELVELLYISTEARPGVSVVD